MAIDSLKDLFVDQLRDLYDAENQLIKALPKLAEASNSEELRDAFEEHLEQTKGHAHRLETIFESFGQKAKAKKCKGMEGLIKEGSEQIDEDMDPDVKDAALIAAAQRVEHYEISGYGTARTFANQLGEEKAASLLQQTLDEEKETDAKLNDLASEINVAAEEAEGEAEVQSTARTARRRKPAA